MLSPGWPQSSFLGGAQAQVPLDACAEETLGCANPGSELDKRGASWVSSWQTAGHRVWPNLHKVHRAQQRAHLLMLLQGLAQVLQVLLQLRNLPAQDGVLLLQALVLLFKKEGRWRPVWRCKTAVPALGRERREGREFKASLGYRRLFPFILRQGLTL